MMLSSGKATYASHAPLGHTRAGCPLTVTRASPEPAVPKRKLESRTCSTASGAGYITLIASGPRTGGTGGSTRDGGKDSERMRVAGTGTTGGRADAPQAATPSPTPVRAVQ
jgi:hypothetical protein